MYTWKDMSVVKENLWNKLHQIKSSVKDGVTTLAQIVQSRAHDLATQMGGPVQFVPLDSDIKIDSSSKSTHTVKRSSARQTENGVSSPKHMNTHGSMILYFCIMTVLMFCCLGRCLVVPIS